MRRVLVWIEAMRLRTLPVSVAGVIMGVAAAVSVVGRTRVHWVPAALCLVFAVLAQISSNFANEYYDFRAGADRPGRVGPRRGVTEGDITPRAMFVATLAALALACATGLALTCWGGLWLVAVGVFIAVGVFAYSAGPWPLSRHCLGEVAVILFFGVIPVNFTCYLVAGTWVPQVPMLSVAVGLLGANVLVVNNFRDRDDDIAAGKHTLATVFGPKAMHALYLVNNLAGLALIVVVYTFDCIFYLLIPLVWSFANFRDMNILKGSALNKLLGKTSLMMLLTAVLILVMALVNYR